MSDRTGRKLGALAAAIVLLVVAFSGGYATLAAFTDSETATVSFSTGSITPAPGNNACEAGAANTGGNGNGNGNANGNGNGNAAGNHPSGNGNGAPNAPADPCSTGNAVVGSGASAIATPAVRR